MERLCDALSQMEGLWEVEPMPERSEIALSLETGTVVLRIVHTDLEA